MAETDSPGSHSAIGLRRGFAAVRDHDPRWAAEFDRERDILNDLLGVMVDQIEHVGSTAVPGLAAKPLIDIALGFVDRSTLEAARDRLVMAGYDDRRDFDDRGGVIFAKGPEFNRTHLLHLVETDSDQWRRYLAFRDSLRANPAQRSEYGALKKSLAHLFWRDRTAYLEGKREFIEQAIAETTIRPAEKLPRGSVTLSRPYPVTLRTRIVDEGPPHWNLAVSAANI